MNITEDIVSGADHVYVISANGEVSFIPVPPSMGDTLLYAHFTVTRVDADTVTIHRGRSVNVKHYSSVLETINDAQCQYIDTCSQTITELKQELAEILSTIAQTECIESLEVEFTRLHTIQKLIHKYEQMLLSPIPPISADKIPNSLSISTLNRNSIYIDNKNFFNHAHNSIFYWANTANRYIKTINKTIKQSSTDTSHTYNITHITEESELPPVNVLVPDYLVFTQWCEHRLDSRPTITGFFVGAAVDTIGRIDIFDNIDCDANGILIPYDMDFKLRINTMDISPDGKIGIVIGINDAYIVAFDHSHCKIRTIKRLSFMEQLCGVAISDNYIIVSTMLSTIHLYTHQGDKLFGFNIYESEDDDEQVYSAYNLKILTHKTYTCLLAVNTIDKMAIFYKITDTGLRLLHHIHLHYAPDSIHLINTDKVLVTNYNAPSSVISYGDSHKVSIRSSKMRKSSWKINTGIRYTFRTFSHTVDV